MGDDNAAGDTYVDDAASVVDFVVAAYREEGRWQVTLLPRRSARDLATLEQTLRRHPGDGGSLGLVSVDDDYFLIVRVAGADVRLLLSDVTAATESALAREALDELGLAEPDDEDEPEPAGDTELLADLGLAGIDLEMLCDDDEIYPDQALGEVAERLGFGRGFAAVIPAQP